MYVNTLISLEENMPTYGIDGKKITGHVTLTSPGSIKCYVQNLYVGEQSDFVCYAFSSKEGKGIRLGKLSKTRNSKETRWSVDEKNVMNSRVPLWGIDAVAIIKEGDGMRNTDTILVGFAGSRYVISSMVEGLIPKVSMPKGVSSTEKQADILAKQTSKTSLKTGSLADKEQEIKEVVEKSKEMPKIVEAVEEETPKEVAQTAGREEKLEKVVEVAESVEDEKGEQVESKEQTEKIIDAVSRIGAHKIAEVMEKESIGIIGKDKLREIISLLEKKDVIQPSNREDEYEEKAEEVVCKEAKKEEFEESQAACKEPEQEAKLIRKSFLEEILKEKFIKQQREGIDSVSYREEELYEDEEFEEENKGIPETPEEINYLEEIERKLKDIQSRLRGNGSLEESINKIRMSEAAANEVKPPVKEVKQVKQVEPPLEVDIKQMQNKITTYKSKMMQNKKNMSPQEKNMMVKNMYNKCVKVTPFEKDNREWKKISLSELVSIPKLSMQWCIQPMIIFAYYKYNEFLMGKQNGTEDYYIGIPDTYQPERSNMIHKDKEVEGFKCTKDMSPTIGEKGYWIIKL